MTERAPVERLHVAVPDPAAASYDVLVGAGALDDLPLHAADVAGLARWVVISDATVERLYGDRVRAAFERAGTPIDVLTFEPGEANKSRGTWAGLCDRIFELGVGRDTGIVALGGGVTGDLAGFVAATVMRGLPLIHAPTTLLAMVECVGRRQDRSRRRCGEEPGRRVQMARRRGGGSHGLATLSDDDFRAGFAEAVKHAAIADVDHFEWLGRGTGPLLQRDPAVLGALIRRSIGIKASVVSEDPLETGRRAILNFGHTIAHAVERCTDYAVPHGSAVSMGMVAEARLGERLGVTEPGSGDRLEALLRGFGLPVTLPRTCTADDLLGFARLDKKNRGAKIRCALPARIGEMARAGSGEWTVACARCARCSPCFRVHDPTPGTGQCAL